MKLKLFTLLAMVVCFGQAKADLLYWQVSSPVDVYESVWATTGAQPTKFAYARIFDASSDTAWNNVSANGVAGKAVTAGSANVAANIGTDYSGGSFYIVIYDSSWKKLAWTEDIAYSTVSSSYIEATTAAEFNSNWTNAMAMTSFKFVPEPTSGLLMLLGAALLGLRRKRLA